MAKSPSHCGVAIWCEELVMVDLGGFLGTTRTLVGGICCITSTTFAKTSAFGEVIPVAARIGVRWPATGFETRSRILRARLRQGMAQRLDHVSARARCEAAFVRRRVHRGRQPDEMRHYLERRILWIAAGTVDGNRVGAGALDRLTLADAHGEVDRICAVVRLICAFGMFHAAQAPWAASLPPDAGRDARPAVSTLAGVHAVVGVAAERVSQGPRVRAAVCDGRGRARDLARDPSAWT